METQQIRAVLLDIGFTFKLKKGTITLSSGFALLSIASELNEIYSPDADDFASTRSLSGEDLTNCIVVIVKLLETRLRSITTLDILTA
jgi:hypothetical protein